MSYFIVLLRYSNVNIKDITESEYKFMVTNVMNWAMKFDKYRISSGKLEDEGGITLRMIENKLSTDGPFCESKEAIAGFFIFECNEIEDVIKIAKECPILKMGGTLEIRKMSALTER